MGREKTVFVCQNCGYRTGRWLGRCPSCGGWNTLVEEAAVPQPKLKKRGVLNFLAQGSGPVPITEASEVEYSRFPSGIGVLDAALGGGLVKGQVSLIAGEPGIGKSTLLLQLSKGLAEGGKKVLYVSGEESAGQIYLRAKRLGALDERIVVLPETVLEKIEEAADEVKPDVLILDSVQTVFSADLESSAGSVSQVREVTYRITELAKRGGITAFVVGHVNKEGQIAGPKVLEHIVDTVLQFEGERGSFYRVLKVVKNRFGPSGEIAVFKMTSEGLREVPEPSAFFVSERNAGRSGTVVFPHTEGTKPVLLEVQALVLPAVYSTPQRRSEGFDPNRLSLILAVLEKEAGIFLRDKDVFVNVVGGVEVDEPGIDAAVALAVASSAKNKPVPPEVAVFGELGLTGELRNVYFAEARVKEAKRFGFNRVLVPKTVAEELKEEGVEGYGHVKELLEAVL
ncbi:MAG: DNA repair protein RadA [Aquificae bacterium]|nr:DNA repair protein RadA [Aquificota bacterium]